MNLGLALWVSVINFWAWNLVGPLSTTYAAQMRLSSTEASVLVATPILVGSLGRLVTGPLTDRFGGRILFIAVCVASILPVLAVGAAGTARSYPLLLVSGFFLGVAGTVFAIGIPFANNWYEPAGVALRRACSAWAWSAPLCRRFSPRGLCGGSACSPRTWSSRWPWQRPRRCASSGCATRRPSRRTVSRCCRS